MYILLGGGGGGYQNETSKRTILKKGRKLAFEHSIPKIT